MNHRKDIINYFVNKIKASKYLELGLRNPNNTFNHINCPIKHSVDINNDFATYTMSTDDFFKNLDEGNLNIDKDYKWDIIFIDANHLADFVKNDTLNSLTHLSSNGFIFLHDILPLSYNSQLETSGNQTAWKIIPYLLKNHPKVHVCSVPEKDGGIGIVFFNPDKDRKVLDKNHNPFFEYYIMDVDRKTSQNLIDLEQIDDWISNPVYNFKNPIIEHKKNIFKEFFIK